MSIIAENLNYIYMPKTPYEKQALKNLNFSIETGEFFGIIGHTGSGKSTLVQHFNALIKPTSGRIIIDGTDITAKKTDLKALRHKVGMVFQYPENQLFEETVEKDVAYGPKNLGFSKEKIAAAVSRSMNLVGLPYNEFKDRSPFDLSGGQRRRIDIARALLHKPELLILDEPTAGLDPAGKREIMNLVTELKAQCTPTVIMISHDMEEIARYADRVMVLSGGEIKYILPPAELFSKKEELNALGLDVPEITELCYDLIGNGYKFTGTVLNEKEFIEAILPQLKERLK